MREVLEQEAEMFKIGDYVAHYKEGVCEVVNIGKIDMGSSDKEYYTLKPVYDAGGTVYTPVDNKRDQIRKLITKEENHEHCFLWHDTLNRTLENYFGNKVSHKHLSNINTITLCNSTLILNRENETVKLKLLTIKEKLFPIRGMLKSPFIYAYFLMI